MQLFQGAALFRQMWLDAAHLFALEFGAEGHHQSAFLPPHLAVKAEGAGGFQTGIVQGLKLLARPKEEIGEVGGHQRADKVEAAVVEDLLIADRVVALIEHQGDGLAVAGQGLVASGQFLQGLRESDAIVLIAGVDFPQQGHVKIDAHQQGQADQTQVGALALGMAALGELAGILGVDKGIEVGAIEDQAGQVQVKGFDHALGERFAEGGDLSFAEQFHVVPEALRGKLQRATAEPAGQRGRTEPSGHAEFAGGRQAAVEGRDH